MTTTQRTARFGVLLLTGRNTEDLAAKAKAFLKTPEGKSTAKMARASGQRIKGLLSQTRGPTAMTAKKKRK